MAKALRPWTEWVDCSKKSYSGHWGGHWRGLEESKEKNAGKLAMNDDEIRYSALTASRSRSRAPAQDLPRWARWARRSDAIIIIPRLLFEASYRAGGILPLVSKIWKALRSHGLIRMGYYFHTIKYQRILNHHGTIERFLRSLRRVIRRAGGVAPFAVSIWRGFTCKRFERSQTAGVLARSWWMMADSNAGCASTRESSQDPGGRLPNSNGGCVGGGTHHRRNSA